MELNNRAEMNEIPLLEIGRQSYEIVPPDSEQQPGASAWSPMDCNEVVPSTMNNIWHAGWRPYTGDLPHSYSWQAQHRGKRQHCWGASSLISEQPGVGPSSSSEDESIKGLHAELYGGCETANLGNPGFDFFQPTSNAASTSRTHGPSPHSLMLVSNSRQAITANETGHWHASASQGTGLGPFFTENDWRSDRDSLSSESAENTKGKVIDHFNSSASGSSTELSGCQEPSYFSSVLLPQREHEKETSGSAIECMPKQRTEEAHGDFRSAYKRKLSHVDIAEGSGFESQHLPTSESSASRIGGFGASPCQTGLTNFYPISSTSATVPWGDSCNDSSPDYASNDISSARGLVDRSSGLFGSGEDAARCVTNQLFSTPNDMQSNSQVLFARHFRRAGHAHLLSRRNLDSGSSNAASSTSLLQNIDHWPALGGEISPPPPPSVSNWGASGSRRNSSTFSMPGSRDRVGLQGAFEGSHYNSMQDRALDWVMAAAAPSPATSEHRLTSQLFPSGGLCIPTGREVDVPESSDRITQTATSFFNSGALASYCPASGSESPRASSNPLQPVSMDSNQQIPAGPSLEAYGSVPGQPAGRTALLSPSYGRRDARFFAPVQSLLGLPFRGLHTLRADGEYRRQFLSEILNAMHHAFRNEDLNIEELVTIDPSIIYGDAHDQHRDMRLDVDNMTYEELLALEERIGNVSTGLEEEKISLCLRESKYSSLDATVAAISQDSDIKCSICQEEFVEEDELGRLDCSHGYHSACIRQWLLQKNECPICKASAYLKP